MRLFMTGDHSYRRERPCWACVYCSRSSFSWSRLDKGWPLSVSREQSWGAPWRTPTPPHPRTSQQGRLWCVPMWSQEQPRWSIARYIGYRWVIGIVEWCYNIFSTKTFYSMHNGNLSRKNKHFTINLQNVL